jgi:glutathione synthase/RimK-type ligase-like ATP-grasp enzyme
MILLWGIPEDGPLGTIQRVLERRGGSVRLLDQQTVLDCAVELDLGERVTGRLGLPSGEIDLDKVDAAYLRPYDFRRMAAVARAGEGSDQWLRVASLEEDLWLWAQYADALVLNRPDAMATNSSKPYQAELIRRHGFRVPDTLITTDADAAAEFWEGHREVVYKSVSAVRSIVSRLAAEHLPRFADIGSCPTQFQEMVPGVDHRVHVVGTDVFCSRIRSAADDYRYAHERNLTIDITATDLPSDCADRCRELSAALGFSLAGIDLRLTPDGEWFCFEVNPSPGFTYYDREPGEPIAESIGRLLMGAA